MGNEFSHIETNYAVKSRDAELTREQYDKLPKRPIYFVLDNLRSAFNVGAIFRTCDALRVSGLYLCGYTACPPHPKLAKTSMGTVDFVPWRHFPSVIEAIADLKSRGIAVWAAETTSHSRSFLSVSYPVSLAIVLGNEALGVDPSVISLCDQIIDVPMAGFKNSLNVATTCGILGYTALEKMGVSDRLN